MGIAVLGVGTISRAVHLPLLARLPCFDLRAVSDLDVARAGEVGRTYAARVLDVPSLLAAQDVEAVLVATPGNHAQIARDALRAGKHVFAEKPLALTAADAEEVGTLADSLGLVLQVGTMKTHDALLPAARAAVDALDDVRLVHVEVRHPADAPQVQHLRLGRPAPLPESARAAAAAADADDSERVRQAIGDVPPEWARIYRTQLCGSLVHQTSLLRALGITLPERFDHADAFGGPVSGSGPGGRQGPPSLTATATLAQATRLVLSWNWLPHYPQYTETVTVLGSSGAVTLDVAPPYVLDARSALTVARGGDGERPAQVVRTVAGSDGAFQRQLEAFADSVRTGAAVASDAAGAALDVRCVQALLRALVDGHHVVLGGEADRRA